MNPEAQHMPASSWDAYFRSLEGVEPIAIVQNFRKLSNANYFNTQQVRPKMMAVKILDRQ